MRLKQGEHMSRKRENAIVFASDADGKLFVKVRAVMNGLIPFIDGLPIVFFGKGKTAYLEIDTAIAWCRKESQYHSGEKYNKMIEVMEIAKRQEAASTAGPLEEAQGGRIEWRGR